MDRVVLTGASGFIGRHCLPHLLESGFEVHAIHKQARTEETALPNLYWHKVDLLDPHQFEALFKSIMPSHLLHLAWYAEPGKFWSSELNKDWLESSKKLFEAFVKAGGQRLVAAGTGAEYDWSDGVLKENSTTLNASTYYGKCKTELFQYACELSKSTGISFAWGRIFWLYGPGEDKRRLVPYVINALLNDQEAKCSDGSQMRDFMHVDDLARAFTALLQSPVSGAVNIGSGQEVSIRYIVEHLAREMNKMDLLKLGAVASAANEPALVVADVSRLQNELGFRPARSLEQGLNETIQWWQSQSRDSDTRS